MSIVITVLHVLACFVLIVVVLLQTGKGADIGAVFGGSSQTIFGSSGAGNLLTRLTTWTAVIFMVTSIFLTWSSTHHLTTSIADTLPDDPPPLAAPLSGDAVPADSAPADGTATSGGDAAAPAAEGAAQAPADAPVEAAPSDAKPADDKSASAAPVGEAAPADAPPAAPAAPPAAPAAPPAPAAEAPAAP